MYLLFCKGYENIFTEDVNKKIQGLLNGGLGREASYFISHGAHTF